MKTKTINLYDFDELTKEQQDKAVENLRDINVDYDDWHRFILEDETEKLAKIGFADAEINYSGFWSQGDGASFTCKHVDLLPLAHKLSNNKSISKLEQALDAGDCTASVDSIDSHYCHENTARFYLEINNEDITDEQRALLEQFEADAEALRKELSQDIYKVLRDAYEDATTDEAVIETIKANEYTFNENGKIES
jgi:hypothetical protein